MNTKNGAKQLNNERLDLEAVPRDGHNRRLDSWKEIANYLNRSVRCAQRWEQSLSLPVRRIRHVKGCTVYAYTADLQAWRQSREGNDPAPQELVAAVASPLPDRAARYSRLSAPLINLCRFFLRAIPLRASRS